MTDETTNRTTATTTDEGTAPAGSGSSEEYAWHEPGAAPDRGEKAREWLGQLQAMIEQLATQAAPVIREVGAKAAELAAAAGDKAGPVASRTAEVTGQAGQKLAERARGLAAELRRDQAAAEADAAPPADTEAEPTAAEPTAEVSEDRSTGMS